MVDAVADLVDAGRVKLYCVDSLRRGVLGGRDLPLEERARRHGAYESWIVDQVVPYIARRQRRRRRHHHHRLLDGRLPRAELRAQAAPTCSRSRCASPATTTRRRGTAGASAATRRTSTTRSTTSRNLHGDHLDWLRSRLSVLLVCGQGQWEDTTGSLESHQAHRRAARREGHPARAGPVGPRRTARLAVVARPVRPPPAAVLLSRRRTRLRRSR